MTITDLQRDAAGKFSEHQHGAPDVALLTVTRPYSDDQSRLASQGFAVSHDAALIEGYTVEPGIWRQNVSVPDLRHRDLNKAQRDSVSAAAKILDERRGRVGGLQAPWHRADCFAEPLGGTAVYIRSRPEAWANDSNTLRILIDSEGGVVDVREGVAGARGGTVWSEL